MTSVQEDLDAALLALAEVFAFIPDRNNAQSPAVVLWHIRHTDILHKAAARHNKLHMFPLHTAEIPNSILYQGPKQCSGTIPIGDIIEGSFIPIDPSYQPNRYISVTIPVNAESDNDYIKLGT